MLTATLSALLPNYTPTWTDVVVWILVAVSLFFDLFTESTTWIWTWVVVGFLLTMIAVGPVTKTSVGRLIGNWFQEIGVAGRGLVILLFLAGALGLINLLNIPNRLVDSFANGILL